MNSQGYLDFTTANKMLGQGIGFWVKIATPIAVISVPTISGISPSTGTAGTTVTITGTGFSTTPASNTVKFNGTQATVTAATATSITVTVPSGATSGTVSVTTAGGTATSAGSFTLSDPGNAAYYFSKKAVANTWQYLRTMSCTAVSTCPRTVIISKTVIASTGGVVTISYQSDPTNTDTDQIDATGTWLSDSKKFYSTKTILPAKISVGATWVAAAAYSSSSYTNTPTMATIAAINVTRTVPAGTFTDCLQRNAEMTTTSSVTTSKNTFTEYYSPTVGAFVERTITSVVTFSDPANSSLNYTQYDNWQLQPGYVAKP